MKKKMLWKDIRTCIAKSKGRFISIMSLIALGSFALVGLQAAGPDMRKTGEAYFSDLNAADLTIIGDYGLDEDDQAAIDQADGVEDIEYGYLKDVVIEGTLTSVRVYSETQRLSGYEMVEGSMPEAEDEIALASFLGDDYPIGSELTVAEKAGLTGTDTLKNHTFTVVGLVNSSELLSKINMGQSTAGTGELSGYAVVVPEAFDSDVYMLARLSYSDLRGVDPYSADYTEKLQAHKDEMSELLKERPALRLASIQAEYQDKIDEGQQEIDDAKAQLSDARQQLEDGNTQLLDAKSQVADAQKELDDAVKDAQDQIDDGEQQLSDAKLQIEDGQTQLDEAADAISEGESQLSAAQSQLAQKRTELSAARAQIQAGQEELSQQQTLIQEKQQEYDENAAMLAEKQQELEAAQGQLDAAQAEIQQKRQELEAGKAQYEGAVSTLQQSVDELEALAAAGALSQEQEAQRSALNAQLVQTQQAYEAFYAETYTPGCAQLDAAQAQLDQQRAQLEAASEELQAGEAELAEAAQQLEDGYAQIAAAQQLLDAAQTQADEGEAQINAAASTLAQSQQTLTEKKNEYAQAAAALDEAKQSYAEKAAELEDAKTTLEQERTDGLSQIADAQSEISEKQQELDDAQAEYDADAPDAEQKIADAEEELAEAREDLEALTLPAYNIDSRRESPGGEGYRIYGSVSDIIDALADVFPIFLYFVAALVALTTMTRFVDEERVNSGTLKALGYDNRDIQKKFVVYGLMASLAGAAIGITAGHILIPMIVYNAYGQSFTYPSIALHFYPGITVAALLLALASAVLPAYLVSVRELREKPASLLLPKAPVAGAKILMERITPIWDHMNFTHKVTARNIFRYKKRMLMTIFGVCGAVTLLFAGFSVQHSISGINDRQFGEILKYDLIVAENTKLTDAEREELQEHLTSDEVAQQLPIYYEEMTKVAGDNQDKQIIKMIVPSDRSAFSDYILLDQRSNGKTISLDDSGAVISERLAKLLDVSAGESVTITDSKGEEHTIKIAAITEMYTGHFLFLSSDYYAEAFGDAYGSNAHLVTLCDRSTDNANAVAAEFMELDGVAGVVQNTTLIGQINTIVASLNKIMDVLIVVAILLAVVILYNLTNINVSERIRELSTIRVLGFYDKEVTLYIYRETILLTLLGILAGFGLGDLLYRYILAVVPPDEVMFNPDLGCKAFLVPTLVVCLITAILGWVIHRRLQKVDMLEALKSVE